MRRIPGRRGGRVRPKSHGALTGEMPLRLLLAELLKGSAVQHDELSSTGGPNDAQAPQGLKLPHHDLPHRAQFLGQLLLTHAQRQRGSFGGAASLENVPSQPPPHA